MTVVDNAVYIAGRRHSEPRTLEDTFELLSQSSGAGMAWIGLYRPDAAEIHSLSEEFSLHELAVEDTVKAHQRPKLERYDDTLFAVLKTVRYCPHEELTETSQIVDSGEVMVFVGEEFVVTVRHGSHGGLRSVRRGLEADPELLALGPSAVLHAIADTVVDSYVEVTDLMQVDIDELEELVFSPRRGRDVERVYLVKRELVELRRSVTPLAQPLRTLAERPMRLVDDRIREYFRDVEDHLTRVRESIQGYDDLLTSILQASLAQLSVAENEDMRKITAWAAIIAVPTAIAGVYGMNFEHLPELGWRYGYLYFWLAVIAVVLGVAWVSRRARLW